LQPTSLRSDVVRFGQSSSSVRDGYQVRLRLLPGFFLYSLNNKQHEISLAVPISIRC